MKYIEAMEKLEELKQEQAGIESEILKLQNEYGVEENPRDATIFQAIKTLEEIYKKEGGLEEMALARIIKDLKALL